MYYRYNLGFHNFAVQSKELLNTKFCNNGEAY